MLVLARVELEEVAKFLQLTSEETSYPFIDYSVADSVVERREGIVRKFQNMDRHSEVLFWEITPFVQPTLFSKEELPPLKGAPKDDGTI